MCLQLFIEYEEKGEAWGEHRRDECKKKILNLFSTQSIYIYIDRYVFSFFFFFKWLSVLCIYRGDRLGQKKAQEFHENFFEKT